MITIVTWMTSPLSDHFRQDKHPDSVQKICVEMGKRKSWTGKNAEQKQQLLGELLEQKYRFFIGDPYYYGLTRIGESVLCNVPEKQRGHLKPNRGKRVRIVCTETGKYKRMYAVKEL
jgi:hypothetical protein